MSTTARHSSRIAAKTAQQKMKQLSKKSKGKARTSGRPSAKKSRSKPVAGYVYLRTHIQFLHRFPNPTNNNPNPQPLPPIPGISGNLYALAGDLQAMNKFAGGTAEWLIEVARFIFEPLGDSPLYTFTTYDVDYWFGREMEPSQWRQVKGQEQLAATIYEFRPDNNAYIEFTKICERVTHSATTDTSANQSSVFRTTLLQRHTGCIITNEQIPDQLEASHLLPKRLHDAEVQAVLQHFDASLNVTSRFDPRIGVPLLKTLDPLVNTFELGFWRTGPNQYTVHEFTDHARNLTGGTLQVALGQHALHNHHITLVIHDPTLPEPPAAAFNWHYVQCVLKKFCHPELRAVPNIAYLFQPFHTKDDEDENDGPFDDNDHINNPPYPGFLLDLAQYRLRKRVEDARRHKTIEVWSSEVITTGLPTPPVRDCAP